MVILCVFTANISFLQLGMHFWQGLNASEGTERELGSTPERELAYMNPIYITLQVKATAQSFSFSQSVLKA